MVGTKGYFSPHFLYGRRDLLKAQHSQNLEVIFFCTTFASAYQPLIMGVRQEELYSGALRLLQVGISG